MRAERESFSHSKTNQYPGVRLLARAEGFVPPSTRTDRAEACPAPVSSGRGGFAFRSDAPPRRSVSGVRGFFPRLSLSSAHRRLPGDGAHSPPLVKGGQGREPHALVTSAYVFTIGLAIAGVVVLVEVAS